MIAKLATNLLAAAALCLMVLPNAAAQNQEQPTLYVQVDCMKSTSSDYSDVETDIWQPMHQEMVNQGKKNSWALYWVRYGDRSECDYYTVNTYLGLDQLNDPTPFGEVFAAVHPDKDWAKANSETAASRELVRTEVWTWVDGIPPTEHRYAQVNQMHAHDGTNAIQKEIDIWKPIHKSLADDGHRAGWGLYNLWMPNGTTVPYNYGTVDFLKQLGPVPMAEAVRKVHPNREMSAIFQAMDDARDFLHGEIWALVASTTPAAR